MGLEYTEVPKACWTWKRREQLHIGDREAVVSSLVDMFLRIGDAILFKEFVHVRGDCREVNDLVVSNPCTESWGRVCRFGLKSNEFHKYSF